MIKARVIKENTQKLSNIILKLMHNKTNNLWTTAKCNRLTVVSTTRRRSTRLHRNRMAITEKTVRRHRRVWSRLTETPVTPEVALFTTTTELEQLISDRLVVAQAQPKNVCNATSGASNGGNVNRQWSSSQGDIRGPQRTCNYTYFTNYKPKNFYLIEGIIGLTRWIEKMKSVFQISFCPHDSKVWFVVSMFMDSALTWWNDQLKTLTLYLQTLYHWKNWKWCSKKNIAWEMRFKQWSKNYGMWRLKGLTSRLLQPCLMTLLCYVRL